MFFTFPKVPRGFFRHHRSLYGEIARQLYAADPLICRRCDSPMRILAVITEPQQVRKILLHRIKSGKAPRQVRTRHP